MEPRQDLMESIIEAIAKATKDLSKLIADKDAEITKLKSDAADKESVDSEQSSRLQQALTAGVNRSTSAGNATNTTSIIG